MGTAFFLYGGRAVADHADRRPAPPESSSVGARSWPTLRLLAWLFAVPGIAWTGLDLIRRFGEAAEKVAIGRATAKYGAGAEKQGAGKGRHRQVFLRPVL